MPYSNKQLALAARYALFDFVQEIDKQSMGDLKLLMRIDRLLLTIFLAHQDGRLLSKTQACRMIAAEHTETCMKYVDAAAKRGLLSFKKDRKDGRRINVVPTRSLISIIRAKAAVALDEMNQILSAAR
jgi:hypothetical protein